ncbi:MAG: hypothetical protein GY861_28885, partial [bacterium]|nr:hypothetical protein [bacterium]
VQKQVVDKYLQSEVDKKNTQSSYEEFVNNNPPDRVSWVKEKGSVVEI